MIEYDPGAPDSPPGGAPIRTVTQVEPLPLETKRRQIVVEGDEAEELWQAANELGCTFPQAYEVRAGRVCRRLH